MEPETRELLLTMEARLERMEARQRARSRQLLLALAAAALVIALLFAMLTPTVRRYNAMLDALEPVTAALQNVDTKQLAASLESLSGMEGLDAEALQNITQKLQQLDPAMLETSLEKLQQIDTDRLNGALAQLENVLTDLDGLDAEAINTAITNLNKTLGPLLALFER